MALSFAVLSAMCFGTALVTGRVGLRSLDARSGAAVSIPTATVLFVLAAPFALDITAFDVRAAMLFAAVGLFFLSLQAVAGAGITVAAVAYLVGSRTSP